MDRLHTTRYAGKGITCRTGTVFFDESGNAEVPDGLGEAFAFELRDVVLVVEKKPKAKKKAETKAPAKKKTTRKKKGGK